MDEQAMDEQAIVKLVPGTQASDADGVKMSLEAARALAMSGEPEEALRLVRRAAESAEQAGDDLRSIQLARAAADIANEVERVKKGGTEASASGDDGHKKPLPSPPSRPPKSGATPPPLPVASAGAAPHAPAPPSARSSQLPPAPSGKSSPQAAPPPQEVAADEPHASPLAHAEAPSEHAEAHAPRSSPKAPVEPSHADAAERPAAAPKKVEPRPAPATAAHVALVAPPGMNELVSQGRAVRVLVKRSARDESLYIVRPHSTAHVPVGAREAFLVLGDADPDFLAGATR